MYASVASGMGGETLTSTKQLSCWNKWRALSEKLPELKHMEVSSGVGSCAGMAVAVL